MSLSPAICSEAAPALPRLGERAPRGREINAFHRGSRQGLGAARREAPCIPAPSSCRPPRSAGPQRVTACISGSIKGCARVSASLSRTGQLGEMTTGLLAGKSCLKEKQSQHWTFQAFYLIRWSRDWKRRSTGRGEHGVSWLGSQLPMHTSAPGTGSLGEQPTGLLLLPANTWTRPLPVLPAGERALGGMGSFGAPGGGCLPAARLEQMVSWDIGNASRDGSGRCPSGIRCSISGILLAPVAVLPTDTETRRNVGHSCKVEAGFVGWRGVLHGSALAAPYSCSWR